MKDYKDLTEKQKFLIKGIEQLFIESKIRTENFFYVLAFLKNKYKYSIVIKGGKI